MLFRSPEESIPIFEDHIWNSLSETKTFPKGGSQWTGRFRASLNELESNDAEFLINVLTKQAAKKTHYPFTERDKRQLAKKQVVPTPTGSVIVEIPSDEDEEEAVPESVSSALSSTPAPESEPLKSIEMQAKVARIGAQMGFSVWVPRK